MLARKKLTSFAFCKTVFRPLCSFQNVGEKFVFNEVKKNSNTSNKKATIDIFKVLREYNSFLTAEIESSGHARNLKKLAAQIKHPKNEIDEKFWIAFFKQCRKTAEPTLAYLALKHMHLESDNDVHHKLAHLALRTCGLHGKPAQVKEIMSLMERTLGMELKLLSYETLMQAYALEGDLEGAIRTYSYVQSIHPRNSSPALDMTEEYTALRPTLKTQKTLMFACAKAGHYDMAKQLFTLIGKDTDATSGKPPADHPAWGLLVQAAVKGGDLATARQIVDELVGLLSTEKYPRKSAQAFNHVLSNYVASGDFTGVAEVLELMRESGVSPDMHTYSMLVNALSQGLSPDVISGTIFAGDSFFRLQEMDSYSADTELSVSAAMEVLVMHMLLTHELPNCVVWRCISRHFVSVNDFKGLQHIARIVLSFDPYVSSDPYAASPPKKHVRFHRSKESRDNWAATRGEIWSSLVGAAGQLGLWQEALSSVLDLEKCIANQSKHVNGAVVSNHLLLRSWERAVRAAVCSGEQSPQLSWKRGQLVIKEMRKVSSNRPTVAMWRKVLDEAVLHGSAEDIVELMLRMRRLDGHFPDENMWTGVVDTLVARGVCGMHMDRDTDGILLSAREACEKELLFRYLSGSPAPTRKDVMRSLPQQMRSFSGVASSLGASYAYASASGGEDGLDRIPSARYSSSAHSVDGDAGSDGEEMNSELLETSVTGLAQLMQLRAKQGDASECIRLGGVLMALVDQNTMNSNQGSGDYEGEKLSSEVFDSLMEVCLSKGIGVDRLQDFYLFMVERMDVEPSRKSIALVVRALCCEGKEREAMDIARADLLENETLRKNTPAESASAVVLPILQSLARKRMLDEVTAILGELVALDLASNSLFVRITEEFISSKDLERCLLMIELWTRTCSAAGKEASQVCQSVFRLIWTGASPSARDRPHVEKWALSETFCETLLKRKAKGEVSRGACLLYARKVMEDRPTEAHKYLAMLLAHQTEVELWEDFLDVLADHARDEEAEWALQCMNNASRAHDAVTPKPSPHCWGTVARALCAGGRLTEAWEMLRFTSAWTDADEVEGTETVEVEDGLEADDERLRYWYTLLDAAGAKGDYKLGLDVIDSMRELGLQVDDRCWQSVITTALRRGDSKTALRSLRDMTRIDEIEKPSLEMIYKPMLDHFVQHDMPQEVVTVVRHMESRKVSVDTSTWKRVEKMRRFDMVMDALDK